MTDINAPQSSKKYLVIGLFILLVVIFTTIFYIMEKEQPSITNIDNDGTTNIQGRSYNQLRWNGISLNDSTVYNATDNTCTSDINNFKVVTYNCHAQDIDRKDITQPVDFQSKFNVARNITGIFVYDGQLEKGNIAVVVNRSRNIMVSANTFVNNYLVDGIVSTQNLTTKPEYCNLGSLNNTQWYNVTRYSVNGTYSQIICFTSRTVVNATSIRISGNTDTETTKTVWGLEQVDVTDKVEFLGTGLLQDNRSYYKIQDVEFSPQETIRTIWTYTPKDRTKDGKWHILLYDSQIGLINSVQDTDLYLYQDPSWASDGWPKYKQLNVTGGDTNLTNFTAYVEVQYDSDMNATFKDLRVVNGSSDSAGELPFNFDFINATTAGIWIKFIQLQTGVNSIYIRYGNPTAAYGNSSDTYSDQQIVLHFTDSMTNVGFNSSISFYNTSNFGYSSTAFGKSYSKGTEDNQGIESDTAFKLQDTTGSFYYSVFIASGKVEKQYQMLLRRYDTATGTWYFGDGRGLGSDNVLFDGGGAWASNMPMVNNTMFHYGVVINNSIITHYSNGVPIINQTNPEDLTYRLRLLSRFASSQDFLGNITEFRYMTNRIVPTPAYVKRDYQNLNLSNFVFGGEETSTAANDVPQFVAYYVPANYTYSYTTFRTYGVGVTDSGGNGTVNVTLYLDGIPRALPNSTIIYSDSIYGLKAGVHTVYFNATDNGGNSNVTETFLVEIYKATPSGTISVIPTDPEILNGTTTNVSGAESNGGDGDVIYNFTRDGVQVSNPDIQTFLINGSRYYNYSASSGENYTGADLDTFELMIVDGSLSWPTRKFNNSLLTENLTFTGSDSFTRYVAVPSSVTFVTQGIMNLSGNYYFNGSLQGLEAEHTLSSGGFNRGITKNSTNLIVVESTTNEIDVYNLTYDHIYSTTLIGNSGTPSGIAKNDTNYFISNVTAIKVHNFSGSYLYTLVSIPTGNTIEEILHNGSDILVVDRISNKLRIYDSSGTNLFNYTLTVPSGYVPETISTYNDYMYIYNEHDTSALDSILVYYLNGTYTGLNSSANSGPSAVRGSVVNDNKYLYLTSTKLTGYYLNTTPINVNVSVGNKQGYYHPGIFYQSNNRTQNLYSLMNDYLDSCTYVNSWCYVPITFTSATGGILTYSDMYYSDVGFYENNNIYSTTTYETKSETFIYNISYNSNFYTSSSANLIYDGVTYTPIKTVTTGAGTFTKTIDIPLINTSVQNKTFYWIVYLTNNTGQTETFNSSMFDQTVSSILFAQCNTTLATRAVNYSIYNETSRTLITSSFKSTFEYFLGSGSVKKNTSVDLSGSNNYTFCISPNATYNTDASIKLSTSGFLDRNYFLNNEYYSNTSTNEPLYLLDSTVGRNVILEFKDTSLRPLAGYYIETWRKYDALGIDLPVHIDKTDNFGQVVENMVENTVKYKFRFYDPNNTLVKSTNEYVVVACRYTVCVITFLNDQQTGIIGFNNLSNYEYSLYFDNSTNTFIYSWNDNTGSSPHHRLYVKKTTFGSDEVVCNTSSTALIGSLSCYVGGNYSSYSAQAFRFASPEKRIGSLNVQVGDVTRKFGVEGLLWSFFLLMMLIVIGIWYPPVGVGLYIVGFILLSVTGIIRAPPEVWIAQIAIGVAFIWAFRG